MASQLAPGFLVAAPSLLDPNFKRTVVMLVEHRPEGSLGFVINRPAELELRSMLKQLGLPERDSPRVRSPVLVGGPVLPERGWVVFEHGSVAASGEDVVRISDHLAVSASREMLEALVGEDGPERILLVLGYAGWDPGQLDAEIAQGAWIPVDFDERILFDTPFDERWGGALRILGIDPARLAIGVPEA
ncbi:MAG: YqgE/AlgH family protein [Polyangiales bacterium]